MNTNIPKTLSPNFRGNYLNLGLLVLSLMAWLAMFAIGLVGYSGSKVSYALFSIVTGVMLVTGFRQTTGYGYLFLTIFLWLGFWLKMTLHTILNYPFVEAVGAFLGSAGSWDDVLHAATVASLGVMLGKVLFTLVKSCITSKRREIKPVAPIWYAKSRKWLWIGLMFTATIAILVNMKYGLHQIGLVPRTVLMWPLNAVIAWLLNIGLATGIAVLLWWDITLKKNVTAPIYAIIAEALFSSVSVLSRAVYVFHVIPQLWAVHRLKHTFQGWSRAKIGVLAVVFFLCLIVSISAVTAFRNYLYQSGAYSSTAYQEAGAEKEVLTGKINTIHLEIKNVTAAEQASLQEELRKLQVEKMRTDSLMVEEKIKWAEAMKSGSAQSRVLLNEFGYQVTDGVLTQILGLSVDRWIGLEGLMAVQSYPEKNMDLFLHALNEKPEPGKLDIFQTISNSIYLKSDSTKFRFGTLPGAAAFLYYSNSLLIVMLGMAFFSLAVLIAESCINALTANPILCSLYGVVMASIVTQFGGLPRQNVPYFFMLACGILFVWIVHTSFFTQALRKLKLLNNATM